MILCVSLMAIKGFASLGVEAIHAEGKELFRLSDPSPQLFNMLYLLGLFYIVGGKIRSALEIANQLLKLAEELKDPTLAMEAHRAKGATLIEMGRCAEALEHFNQASHLYSANRHHPYTLTIGHDCKVLVECSAARALWALGFPDTALERMQGGLAFARELSHPQSRVAAGHCAAELHQLRGEPLLAQERAREVLSLAEENGLELWVAFGKIDLGAADAELGNIQHGIEQMEQGLAAYEATGGRLWFPFFLGLLADALAKAGRVQEGLATIAKALTMAECNSDAYALPELHRIKGELLLNSVDLARADDVPEGSGGELQ